jgi:dienelactone hydrolase
VKTVPFARAALAAGAAAAALAFHGRAAAQGPPRGLEPESVLAYTGVYRAPGLGPLAVSLGKLPFGAFPVLSDVRTGQVRLLHPAGRDTFVAGPDMARRDPQERRFVFRRDGRGAVSAVEVQPPGSAPAGERRVAERSPGRAVPVSFPGASGTLRGTLHLPASARGRVPAVVLAHGSEEFDRYGFGALPLVLAEHGIAALAYDKRGTGESPGSWESAGIEELAADLGRAVEAVRGRAEIDPGRVCVVGISEGGWVAPHAAALSPGVACIVAVSGGGRTKGDAYIYKNRRLLEERGLSGAALDSALHEARETIRASAARVEAGRGATGFDRRVSYDPTAHWRAFRGPVLAMVGQADVLEDGEAAAEWLRALFAGSGHADYTVRLFPSAHHGILVGAAPAPSAFQQMRGMAGHAPAYWDTLLGWLARRLGPVHAPPGS